MHAGFVAAGLRIPCAWSAACSPAAHGVCACFLDGIRLRSEPISPIRGLGVRNPSCFRASASGRACQNVHSRFKGLRIASKLAAGAPSGAAKKPAMQRACSAPTAPAVGPHAAPPRQRGCGGPRVARSGRAAASTSASRSVAAAAAAVSAALHLGPVHQASVCQAALRAHARLGRLLSAPSHPAARPPRRPAALPASLPAPPPRPHHNPPSNISFFAPTLPHPLNAGLGAPDEQPDAGRAGADGGR